MSELPVNQELCRHAVYFWLNSVQPVMNAAQARALLHGFSGYSPALPPIINSMILELYLAARDPARPQSGPGREALNRHYSLSFEAIHRHFVRSTHELAVSIR